MTRAVLIVNSVKADAAQARELHRAVSSAFEQVGWPPPELRLTSPQDHGGGIAREAVGDGAQLVVACGGDGTVNVVAEALAGTGVTMGIVPLGTGNLLAANLGIPTGTEAAAGTLVTGADRAIDLGRSGERVFTGMAGLGLDAAMVTDAPDWLKKRVGWPAYLVSIARHLADRGVSVTLDLDGRRVRRHGVRTLLIGNIGRLQAGLQLLPDAEPDDGRLDVVVLAPPSPLTGWVSVLIQLLTHRESRGDAITRYRAQRISVRTRHAVAQELDGEPYRHANVLDVEVQPKALLIRVPAPDPQSPAEPSAQSGSPEPDSR